jgi:hypothetical protein
MILEKLKALASELVLGGSGRSERPETSYSVDTGPKHCKPRGRSITQLRGDEVENVRDYAAPFSAFGFSRSKENGLRP